MLTHRPVHPGEIVQEQLDALNLSAAALARAIRVPPNRISMITAKKRAMTADTAIRLARYFKTTSAFWLKLQMEHDLAVVEVEGVEDLDQIPQFDAA